MKQIPQDDANFPIQTDSRLVKFLQKQILLGVKFLAILMTLIILWGTLDVALILFDKVTHPPFLMLIIDDFLEVFGAFLVVMIAIEIFLNIVLYLRKDVIHVKMVIATALMAIARKVIILDYETTPVYHLFGIAAIILSLALAYWLAREMQAALNPNLPKHEAGGKEP